MSPVPALPLILTHQLLVSSSSICRWSSMPSSWSLTYRETPTPHLPCLSFLRSQYPSIPALHWRALHGSSALRRCPSPGTGCPGRWWSLHSWSYSNPWGHSPGPPALEAGPDGAQRCLQPQPSGPISELLVRSRQGPGCPQPPASKARGLRAGADRLWIPLTSATNTSTPSAA